MCKIVSTQNRHWTDRQNDITISRSACWSMLTRDKKQRSHVPGDKDIGAAELHPSKINSVFSNRWQADKQCYSIIGLRTMPYSNLQRRV